MKGAANTKDRTLQQECLIYIFIWLLAFLFPIVNEASGQSAHDPFKWSRIIRWWTGTVPFFGLFLLNRLLLVPRLFMKGRLKSYALATLIALCIFGAVQHVMISSRQHKPFHETTAMHPSNPRGVPPGMRLLKKPNPRIPLTVNTSLAILMIGFNLSIILIFKDQRDKALREEQEKDRLRDELRYLRSQVNPHFFMNMLNNIHALVDIDPKRAKKVIIELSKLMRHTLYDAENTEVSLESEISIVTSYINVMRVRYPEDIVCINMELPENPSPETRIPPLLFMPLLENAFKHGVSYVNDTLIDIKIEERDDEVIFNCRNTRPPVAAIHAKGGLGLENVRRRLNLLYGTDGILTICDRPDSYSVLLKIPVKV